ARRQWNRAMLGGGYFFTIQVDSGPHHRRAAYGHIITKELNKQLRRARPNRMRSQIRSTGAAAMLHGIGPTVWENRRSPVPVPVPIASLMVPSETDTDFENLEYVAIFREFTPHMLWALTGQQVRDPGWNMPLVQSQTKWVNEQIQKQPN